MDFFFPLPPPIPLPSDNLMDSWRRSYQVCNSPVLPHSKSCLRLSFCLALITHTHTQRRLFCGGKVGFPADILIVIRGITASNVEDMAKMEYFVNCWQTAGCQSIAFGRLYNSSFEGKTIRRPIHRIALDLKVKSKLLDSIRLVTSQRKWTINSL